MEFFFRAVFSFSPRVILTKRMNSFIRASVAGTTNLKVIRERFKLPKVIATCGNRI